MYVYYVVILGEIRYGMINGVFDVSGELCHFGIFHTISAYFFLLADPYSRFILFGEFLGIYNLISWAYSNWVETLDLFISNVYLF